MKPFYYHIHAWNSWAIRVYGCALVISPYKTPRWFSERNGYAKCWYIWPVKISLRNY